MEEQYQHNLKPNIIINNYRIKRILGEGSFGITYLAEDISLKLEVVIKEYFPNEFAMRTGDSTITSKSKSKEDFLKGMQRFKEEAQTLAKFNHPSIVKILGYFEENDTAYFVMEYEEGIDLSEYMKQHGASFTQEEILIIMMPILEGLKEVHKLNFLHRDIKPGNILIRKNASPILIDFGASKLALGEASKSITSMLTEGYAPLEQYSTDIKKQGPFTDLYAVAAVIYKMITGEVIPSSQTRSYAILSDEGDPYKPLDSLKFKDYDENFLQAVNRALLVNAKERPQNIEEFQNDIAGKLIYKEKKIIQEVKQEINKEKSSKRNNRLIITFVGIIVVLVGVWRYFVINTNNMHEKEKTIVVQKNKTDTKVNNENMIIAKEMLKQSQIQQSKINALDVAKKEKLKNELDELKRIKVEKAQLKAEKLKREQAALEKERLKKEHEELERLRAEKARLEAEKLKREQAALEEERLKKEHEELERLRAEKARFEAEKLKREQVALEKERVKKEQEEAERQKKAAEEARLAEERKQQMANRGPKYKVINVASNDTLNVRSNPYVASRNKVGELQPYASGFYVIKTTINYKGTKWAYIDYNGLSGWVVARSIAQVGTSTYVKRKKRKKKKHVQHKSSRSSNIWYCKAKSKRASGWVRKVGRQNAMNGAIRQCNNRRQTYSRCRIVDCHIVR